MSTVEHVRNGIALVVTGALLFLPELAVAWWLIIRQVRRHQIEQDRRHQIERLVDDTYAAFHQWPEDQAGRWS